MESDANLMQRPIGSFPGQRAAPIDAPITATRCAPSLSVRSMPRPRTIRVPIVAKYSADTVLKSNSPSLLTESIPVT